MPEAQQHHEAKKEQHEIVPPDQAKAYGKFLYHLFDADAQDIAAHIPDDTPMTEQMKRNAARVTDTISGFRNAKQVFLEELPLKSLGNAEHIIHFSDETERTMAPAGDVIVENPLLANLANAVDDRFSNAWAVVASAAEVIENDSISRIILQAKHKLKALHAYDAIKVVTAENGNKTYYAKKAGEDEYIEVSGETQAPTPKKSGEETTTERRPQPLPREIPRMLAEWMHSHLKSFSHLPMGNDDMSAAVEELESTISQLATADEVELTPLSDNHGWTFTPHGDGKLPPVDLKPQKVTLFRPIARKFLQAVTDTFSNPLSLIRGYAELEVATGNPEYQELLANTITMENEIKALTTTDADLDFTIEADKSVAIFPRPTTIKV